MTIPSTHDTIIWRLHVRSSPEKVFALLDSDAGRASFWAESAIERDGVIHFEFINGMRDEARILERNPPRRFAIKYFGARGVFALDPAPPPGGGGGGGGGTDLTMTNTGFDPADRDDLLPGWLNVLFPLKAAADFGIDLRSHDPTRTWEKGFVDQ